jgi:hypothetical protein
MLTNSLRRATRLRTAIKATDRARPRGTQGAKLVPRVMVTCDERARCVQEHEAAKREFKTAHEAMMSVVALGPDSGKEARSAVGMAQKKLEACRIKLRFHDIEHQCVAVSVSA